VSAYLYDSFGNLTASAGRVTNPFRYTAREFDTEAGLYYYRARYYDSLFGRFLSEDPVGGADKSLYAYVSSDPVNLTDPFGLLGKRPRAPNPPTVSPNTVYYICCRKGKIAICDVPENAPSNFMIGNCENVHEKQHVTDLTANGCNPCEGKRNGPLGVPPQEKSRLECNGYCAELRCLEKTIQLPEIRAREDYVRGQIKVYCGSESCAGH
jgi:RHS repeat-associated protein